MTETIAETVKAFLTIFPEWTAYLFALIGMAVTALAALRLGYGLVVAKTAYKLIVYAEENVVGSKKGEERKKQVVKALQELTPDWLDWAINTKTIDAIVQLVFDFSKKKLSAYVEKKNAEASKDDAANEVDKAKLED